ncbi:MAG: hypothetical protein ACRCVA_00945 [Phreatobacter sp.]
MTTSMRKPVIAALGLLALSGSLGLAQERQGVIAAGVHGCPTAQPVAQMIAWRSTRLAAGETVTEAETAEARSFLYVRCQPVAAGTRVSFTENGPDRAVKVTHDGRTFWVAPGEVR